MKKLKCLCLVMLLLSFQTLALGADVSEIPDVISVNDYSSVISDNTKIFIYNSNEALFDSTDSKIIFVTVPTTGQTPVDEYARQVYRSWGIGSMGDSSSTFVLLATEDMEYWAIVGDHLSSALTRETIEELLVKYMEPDFAAGNFDSAVKNTFIAISDWYTGHYNLSANNAESDSEPADNKKENASGSVIWNVIKALIVVAVISCIGYIIIRRQLRLYAFEQRKRQRIQSYRKYSSRSPGGGDYEYFEFYDTKD
ncbi:MAG: TPM domain-containing protein [Clostridia bacterium]|nr:TPM domain-containing protein [Clostridia bacterium]